MIRAEKSRSFRWLFSHYQRYYLWPRNFHSVHLAGEMDPVNEEPVLYIANHCSWWDGLLLYQLVEQYSERDHYMMMEEKQLIQYPFFRKLGAFSVNKASISDVRNSIKYAKKLMEQRKAVWLFPQGGIFHQEKRPIIFEKGASFLLSRFERTIVKPVSIHYSFNQFQRPTASVIFGEEQVIETSRFNRDVLTRFLETLLENQVNGHRNLVINHNDFIGSTTFTPVMRKGKSTSDILDQIKKGITKWKSYSS